MLYTIRFWGNNFQGSSKILENSKNFVFKNVLPYCMWYWSSVVPPDCVSRVGLVTLYLYSVISGFTYITWGQHSDILLMLDDLHWQFSADTPVEWRTSLCHLIITSNKLESCPTDRRHGHVETLCVDNSNANSDRNSEAYYGWIL